MEFTQKIQNNFLIKYRIIKSFSFLRECHRGRNTIIYCLISNFLQNSDDVFSVEPLAPPTTRHSITMSSTSAVSRIDSEQQPSFMSRINVRLRDIDDQNDGDGELEKKCCSPFPNNYIFEYLAAIGQDDGEISEQDEVMERDSRSNVRPNNANMEEEAQDALGRNEEAAQEGESDTEFNFAEAETESDSDDNQSTQDAQRSVQTGATAGSDTGDKDFMLMEIFQLCYSLDGVYFQLEKEESSFWKLNRHTYDLS